MAFRSGEEREIIIHICLTAFPYMWYSVSPAACLSCLESADLAVYAHQAVSVILFVVC